jgi:hypothetical protein
MITFHDYIAQDSATYALRMVDRFANRTEQIVLFPLSGSLGAVRRTLNPLAWPSRRWTERHSDPNLRAFADFALDGHPTSVGLRDAPTDRQAGVAGAERSS